MSDEITKIVEEINEAIFEADITPEDYVRYLELVNTPIGGCIKYMGCYIWDSENDYREYVKDDEGFDTEEQENLKVYLFKQIGLIKAAIFKSMLAVMGNKE